MKLTHEQVANIAELAKLNLTDEELEHYGDQLSQVLGHFAQLEKLDTANIAPTASVLPLQNVMREDVVQPSLTPEQATTNSRDAKDGQFRVSAVLD